MTRGPLTFRQRDATALFKAMRAAGYDVAKVEFKNGGVVVTARAGTQPEDAEAEAKANEWDVLLP
jgi:hypothetical protein